MPEAKRFSRLMVPRPAGHDQNRRTHPDHHHALLGAAAVAAVISSLITRPPYLLVWNSSSSVPPGLYWIEHSGKIRRGEFVLAWLAHPQREIADERRYLPANVPIIKQVAGVAGDRACGTGTMLRIGRSVAVRRLRADPAGRGLPWWNGCRKLSADEVMLLGWSKLSFDGRYFGPIRLEDIEGRAVPVWTR